MPSFDLKLTIAAPPSKVFAALTEPGKITQWDTCRWALNDMRVAGKLRKRDDHGDLHEGEIVSYCPPYEFAYIWPVAKDPDEPEEGTFSVRMQFTIEGTDGQSTLRFSAQGFPSDALANREKNTWGGYFLEKIKKVAEGRDNEE